MAEFPDQNCWNSPQPCESFRSRNHGWQPPGKAARRAFAEEFAHQQPQVRRTRAHDQPLENIFPAAQMHASHTAAIIQVLIPSFQLFAALP